MSKKYYVYFYYDKNDDLLYIGQAKEGVYERWQSHNEHWKDEVFSIGVREYKDVAIMDVFESYYIKRYPTKYNEARLNYGYTKYDIEDKSVLKKYSLDEFCSKYAPKQDLKLTLEEKIKKNEIEIIETNKIDLFDEKLLSNTNLDKIWFKYKEYICFFEFADTSYKRKKAEQGICLSNKKLHSFKNAVYAMAKRGIDITTQYDFDSEEECNNFGNICEDFEKFTLKIIVINKKSKSRQSYKKCIEAITVGYRGQLKIYEEENNNVIYLISSEFKPHNETASGGYYCAPQYYTVKDFIEISADNFIIDLENFENFYLPSKEKSENDSYDKMNSEAFKNYIKQIQDERQREIKQVLDEQEKKLRIKKEIKDAYWDCVDFLKKYEKDEKSFLIKSTGFKYCGNPENTYLLDEIKTIQKKLKGCCTLKQYNYIEGLANENGLTINSNAFIYKNDASNLIQNLKNHSVDNYGEYLEHI